MSKCMTIADETIDQKEPCTAAPPKDVVDFILEEALTSVFITSEKGCSRIGDFNIAEEHCQQCDELPHLKDFEQVNHSQNESVENRESNLNSGENVDRSSARGNLELIIDSYVKVDEKLKPAGECRVISEEVLAYNELQIQNGQIHLGKSKEDVSADGKIEIEYFNQGKLNKIYVPVGPFDGEGRKEEDETQNLTNKPRNEEESERPFEPLTTEELRQVWGNGNSSLVGKWDGDISAQREEAVRLMEELSSVHVLPDNSADPNRPRACAFDEEDVKKMTKEIEEINFNQCHFSPEDLDVSYRSDGQGDADLEPKPSAKIKENMEKSEKPLPEDSNNDEQPGGSFGPQRTSPCKLFSSDVELPEKEKSLTPSSTTEPPLDYKFNSKPPADDREFNMTSNGYRSVWDPEESLQGTKSDLEDPIGTELSPQTGSSASFILSMQEMSKYVNGTFLSNSANLNGLPNGRADYEKFFPDSISLSDTIDGDPSGPKLDEFTLKNLEFASELDVRAVRGRQSDTAMESRSLTGPENLSKSNDRIQQGAISLGRLNASSEETHGLLNPDFLREEKSSCILSMNTNSVRETGEIKERQATGNLLKGSNGWCEKRENDEDSPLISEEFTEKQEKDINICEKDSQYIENMKEIKPTGNEVTKMGGQEQNMEMKDDTTSPIVRNSSTTRDSREISHDDRNSSDDGVNQDTLAVSETSSQPEDETEKEFDESSEAPNTCTQKFKLHSQKMYRGANQEVGGPAPNEFTLTESEEGLIDMMESVIQVIEPSENAAETFGNVTFSLLSEPPSNRKNCLFSTESKTEFPVEVVEERDHSESNDLPKRLHSGMTTIGPIKNADRDPKDLTAPEIDFGKMTRITSSRQLGKDMGIFNTELTAIKILEEDDSDDDDSMNSEEDRLDHSSLVNRDIASLTKVQKIREVMSHQPKSDEDFEDKDVLPRSRLDLKDVESLTDERYKVTDVGVPLLSFEVNEANITAEKELMESIGLVISGIADAAFYDDETEEPDADYEKIENVLDDNQGKEEELPKEDTRKPSNGSVEKNSESDKEANVEVSEAITDGDEGQDIEGRPKVCTLGNVFRKASTKFIRKDSDLFMRNSKSLPRNTSRISTTDSIRSILGDCHSSATNILKKSHSFLKNTQSMFKSISQSRMNADSAPEGRAVQKKLSPSESDVSSVERKFSGFLKKEDFTKTKNLIKEKVEKTLKSFEKNSPTNEKDMRVAVKNKENLQVDRIENFKKLFPKSPLVYKSQFVKSQVDVQINPQESATAASEVAEEEKTVGEALSVFVSENGEGRESQNEMHCKKEIHFEEKLEWTTDAENQEGQLLTQEDLVAEQPDYIVMETVKGLPAIDLESPSSEKENLNIENTRKIETSKERKEPSNSPQIFSNNGNEKEAPGFPEVEEDKMKPPLEKKMKTKKKNFKARIRSFWCSTFGRVKTPPGKGDLP